MSQAWTTVLNNLHQAPQRWLITGVGGFIGSNLLEFLLKHDQVVVGLDNFSTGFQHNLDDVRLGVTPAQWSRFSFIRGDIQSLQTCQQVCKQVDYILHQAALGSIPRSIDNPITTHDTNITGFLNILLSAKDANIKSFVFASSSSAYGDNTTLPKVEDQVGQPLSPYALTKRVNELYAAVFAHVYGFKYIGLRYFNVFGPRQDPHGVYAAVIPKWIHAMCCDETIYIYGDGETKRDFCFVANVVQANILAAMAPDEAKNQIYNVALNEATSLNQLFFSLKASLAAQGIFYTQQPVFRDFRVGDIRHSQADIRKITKALGYIPHDNIQTGLQQMLAWSLLRGKNP